MAEAARLVRFFPCRVSSSNQEVFVSTKRIMKADVSRILRSLGLLHHGFFDLINCQIGYLFFAYIIRVQFSFKVAELIILIYSTALHFFFRSVKWLFHLFSQFQ